MSRIKTKGQVPNVAAKQEPRMITAGVQDLVQEYDDFLTIPSNEKYHRKYNDVRNKYDVFRSMTEFDSEIASALTRIAAVVAKAYDQPAITKKGNEDLLEDVQEVLGEVGFEHILPNIVHDLSRDGDVVQVPAKLYKRASNTLKKMDDVYPVPINILTVIDDGVTQGMASNYVIRERKKYVLNETTVVDGFNCVQTYDGEIVWHISLNNRGNWSRDIMGRNTFGIWGTSPLDSLKNMVRWKYQSMRDDIAWRHENVPRTDHSLPLDAVLDVNQYSGTMEERIEKAQDMGNLILTDYRNGLTNSGADDTTIDVTQGYVHDANTVVQQIGGNNTYADCLDIVKKVDMSIATRLGIPLSALGYESNSSYAIGKVTVTFMNTFGLQLLSAIQIGTFDFIKRVLKSRGKEYTKAEWNEIYLNYNVTDFSELKEIIEAWTTAYKHGLARLGEGRAGIGLSPIGKEDDPKDENNRYHPNLFQEGAGQTGEKGQTLEDAQKKGDEGGDPALYASNPMPIAQQVKLLSQRVQELEDAED